jgi:hypothetical protein
VAAPFVARFHLPPGGNFAHDCDNFRPPSSQENFATMRPMSNEMIRHSFLGWQCRIRQIAARDYGGQPLSAMRPRVSRKSGEVLMPDMTVLLIPEDDTDSTAYFRFQVQKSADPAAAREAGVKYLAAEFYQIPELFSDEMTAVFGAASERAAKMMKSREVLLDFEQFSQSYRMFCKVRVVRVGDVAREASLWQARLFNPGVANDAMVLGFRPDWKSVEADPFPSGG